MVHSNRAVVSCKPTKPAKPTGCPLFPHANGSWAKKIRGKLHYFGPWGDLPGALASYEKKRVALHSGRVSRPTASDLTIRYLCNAFLTVKKGRVESGELTQRSFNDYHATCERIVQHFGKDRIVADIGPADFEDFRRRLSKKWSPVTVSNEIRRIRVVFNYAYKSDLLDRPVKFGDFGISKKTLRVERARRGPKMFDAAEVRHLLDLADPIMRAMILLAVNAGLGNMDVSMLRLENVDLESGWLDFPRPKTGVDRRCPLWPETVAALREAIGAAPTPPIPKLGIGYSSRGVEMFGYRTPKELTPSPQNFANSPLPPISGAAAPRFMRCGIPLRRLPGEAATR